jgi:hypothetical protein
LHLLVNAFRIKVIIGTRAFLAFVWIVGTSGLLIGGSGHLYAQLDTATLNGTVTDPSGAAIAGASITVLNKDTGAERVSKTNDVGLYSVPSLAPGVYSVTVTKSGFTTANEPSLTLQVDQVASLNLALAVGSDKVTVEVSTSSAVLDTSDASLGTVMPEQVVEDLPLNGRQFTELLQLAPGTVPIDNSQNAGKAPGFGAGAVSPGVDGQTNRSNIFFLDGIIASNPFFGGFSFSPSIDAIQEFKAQSHTDQAQYGQASGAIVSVVSRSGSNQGHGAAYEFVRNQLFDAKDTFDMVKAPYHQNQYGASFGGPIFKNKLFYYANYEGGRQIIGSSINYSTVPTSAERSGDFTGLLPGASNNQTTTLYDPSTYGGGSCNSAGVCTGSFTESTSGPLVSGNKLTPDTSMQSYMNGIYPAANAPLGSNNAPGQNNYLAPTSNINDNDQGSIRIDYSIGQRDSINGRYSQNQSLESGPNGGIANLFQTQFDGKNTGATWVHTVSPTFVAELTGGYNAINIPQAVVTPEDQGALFAKVGFGAGFNEYPGAPGPPQPAEVPELDLTNGSGASTSYSGMWNGAGPIGPMHIVQGGGSATKIAGNHSLKFGASYYHTWMYTNWNGNNDGFSYQATANAACQYVPGPNKTLNSGPAAACPSYKPYTPTSQLAAGQTNNLGQAAGGDAMASLLLSLPVAGTRNLGNSGVNLLENTPEVYAQDTWKVNPRLTITYGLRWDFSSPMREKNNRLATYDTDAQKYEILQNDKDLTPGLLQGLVPLGEFNNVTILHRNSIVTPHYLDFSPRLGFAYDIAPKTTLRAGVGRAFDDWGLPLQVGQQNRGAWPSGLPQHASSNPLNIAGISHKADGSVANGINPFPSGTTPTLVGTSPLPAGGLGFQDPTWVPADSIQWNLEVQRDFNKVGIVSLAYVGSKTNHNTILQPYNTAPASAAPYSASEDPDQVLVNSAQTLRSTGFTKYHSLQAKVTRAFANGLTYNAGFTWSKSLGFSSCGGDFSNVCIQDLYVLQAVGPKASGDYGSTDLDIPLVFTFNADYKLPFGKGAQWVNSGPGAYIVGGWQVNTLLAIRSGTVVNPTYSNVANTNGGNERIQEVSNPNSGAPHKRSEYWNASAFAAPAPGTFGNAQINSLRGPGYWSDDFSLFRDIPITERLKGQFRFEAFDIFNHPNLGNPNLGFGGSNFDVINSTVSTTGPGAQRDIQFAFKLLF